MDGQNLYAPPQAELQSEVSGEAYGYGAMLLASRLSRLGAVCLNALFGSIAAAPIIVGVVLLELDFAQGEALFIITILLSSLMMLGLLAANLYYLTTNGQSLGKKLVGIKIVRSDLRTPVSIWRLIFARWFPMYLVQLVPCAGDIIYLGNFLLIFGAEQKCGHDYIADTQVVRADVAYDDLLEDDGFSDAAW